MKLACILVHLQLLCFLCFLVHFTCGHGIMFISLIICKHEKENVLVKCYPRQPPFRQALQGMTKGGCENHFALITVNYTYESLKMICLENGANCWLDDTINNSRGLTHTPVYIL